MSHTYSTTAPSSNFQLILDNALKVYQKRTKNDILLHPLAPQLQTCSSHSDVLAVLQQQVQGLDQSRSDDDRWTKWLNPTIHVLLTFSGTVGTVGLVCLANMCIFEICMLIFVLQAFSPATVVFAGIGVLLSVSILNTFAWVVLIIGFSGSKRRSCEPRYSFGHL
jgi:hypothetical protein